MLPELNVQCKFRICLLFIYALKKFYIFSFLFTKTYKLHFILLLLVYT